MSEDGEGGEKTWDGNGVADNLEGATGGSEGWGGDELATVIVDDRADDKVDNSKEADRCDHHARVLAGIAHLGDNTEAVVSGVPMTTSYLLHGSSSVREHDAVDGGHGASERRSAENLEVLVPRSCLGSLGGTALDTNSSGKGEDSSHNGDDTTPTDPRNLAEGAD